MTTIINILQLALLYAPVALGIVLVFRIARFPDLTADGSFALGGAVSAVVITMGHPFLSIPLSVVAGALAGLTTALLHVYLGINKLLSGILVMISLYSINLRIMGSANVQLINVPTSISSIEGGTGVNLVIVLSILIGIIFTATMLFFRTAVGLHLRAAGQNIKLITNLGKNPKFYICVGPAIANGLLALSGALVAQYQGFADVNMGFGILIAGLAYLFIGGGIVRSNRLLWVVISAFVGVVAYQSTIYLSLMAGLGASDLKLLTAVFVVLGILLSRIRRRGPEVDGIF